VLAGLVHAQPVIKLTDTREMYSVGPHLEIAEDTTGDWTLRDVQSPSIDRQFEPSIQSIPAFGYSDSVYWMRFAIATDTLVEKAWLLEIANKSLDRVSAFVPTANGQFQAHHVGEVFPFSARNEPHRNFLFRLDSLCPSSQTIYLRFESDGPSIFPVYLWSDSAFTQKDRAAHFFLGVFFGILLIVAIYNASLFVAVGDYSYLFYVFYILSYMLYQLSVERLGFAYLWPENVWWQERANSTLALLCAICAIQFSRSYLHTERTARWMDRVLQGLMGLCVPLIGVNVLFGGRTMVHGIVTGFFIVAITALIATGVICWTRGTRMARYYLVAWGFLLLGTLVALLTNLGIIPYHFWTVRSIQVGSVLEVTLLSLGLGHRYSQLIRARERMRLRIASDLHDDVGSGLTQISFYSELVQRSSSDQAAEWNEKIGVLARSLVDRMQDIVWSIKPEQESWEGLELRMKDYATGLLGPRDIGFAMRGTAVNEPDVLAPDVRQNVLLMFKEAVHNAVRHAGCTQIDVQWTLSRDILCLRICDDGSGFDPATVERGNGLANLQRRAAEIQATLSLDTAPGASTCVQIEVPLQQTWQQPV
jgi:signal transduction histidine kinase